MIIDAFASTCLHLPHFHVSYTFFYSQSNESRAGIPENRENCRFASGTTSANVAFNRGKNSKLAVEIFFKNPLGFRMIFLERIRMRIFRLGKIRPIESAFIHRNLILYAFWQSFERKYRSDTQSRLSVFIFTYRIVSEVTAIGSDYLQVTDLS